MSSFSQLTVQEFLSVRNLFFSPIPSLSEQNILFRALSKLRYTFFQALPVVEVWRLVSIFPFQGDDVQIREPAVASGVVSRPEPAPTPV